MGSRKVFLTIDLIGTLGLAGLAVCLGIRATMLR